MVELRLDQISEKLGGTILQGSPALTFRKFNIDSRQTEPGELFFAITAQRDGHQFVPDAVKKGAGGAVISRKISLSQKNAALLQVKDTLKSLQKLAAEVRREHPVKIVGITGSNGKTTTKEFTSSLLSSTYHVLKSEGNFNNQLGVPLSLLRLRKSHQVAVLEMAMSALGEISDLTRIAPPDVAVITNVNPVHLQFFHSIEEIASAKKEILEGLKPGGTAVLNGDDFRIKEMSRDFRGRKIFFGLSPQCDIRAQNIQRLGFKGMVFDLIYGPDQPEVSFPFYYESFLYNFLAAAAAAYALAVPLEDMLSRIKTLKPFSRRGVLITLDRNIKLIDDSYNSNPRGLEQALKGLADLPSSRKVAVLGDMLELGKKEVEFHIQAGKQLVEWGWDFLVTVGPLSLHLAEGALSAGMKKEQMVSFSDSDQAAKNIWSLLQAGDLVLVKGSRKIKTEKIVEQLTSKRP
ncbi:MAG: UDP-N-acetylmuramoyl-tripeptide--D-alanyl-D-alanine ligase [Candidatus Aminicenantes bacterium]